MVTDSIMGLSSIIGLGEVGAALFSILKHKYSVQWFEKTSNPDYSAEIMHVCIPFRAGFMEDVLRYVEIQKPKYIVVHSSVEVGTTKALAARTGLPVFHSPVRGKHPDLKPEFLVYEKYLSYDEPHKDTSELVADYFRKVGIQVTIWKGTHQTELAKLLELSRYGVYIAFAKEQDDICKKFGCDYKLVVNDYERSRTDGLKTINRHDYIQPILYPFERFVGGHCTVEDMQILLEQYDGKLLRTACDIDRGTVIWGNCNIYKSAKIGKGCSIGNGTEIGHNVIIGDNVRIGAQCFIPEGVEIEDDVFIAPKVTFSNDKYPPSNRESWGNIVVRKGAIIGMGSIILPCVEIGAKAKIGAGSVVTKNVPAGELWYGIAAHAHGTKWKK